MNEKAKTKRGAAIGLKNENERIGRNDEERRVNSYK